MYKFTPIVKTLVWGTERWIMSGVKGSESVVSEGPDAGKTLSEIYGGEFPLLIKFIDAHDDLSIQVHPDDALAAKRHGCNGKTEMWYVTGADKGAHLLSGFAKKLTPQQYDAAVQDGTIAEKLARYDVVEGDVFYLPAGRVHAICGGCHIAEIQQTSDITYRVFDYNRPGLDGKPRQLHTELAKDAIDYTVLPDYRTAYEHKSDSEAVLVDCDYFTTSLFDLTKPFAKDLSGINTFFAVICIKGAGCVSDGTSTVKLSAGESVLVPATCGKLVFEPSDGGFELLTSYRKN